MVRNSSRRSLGRKLRAAGALALLALVFPASAFAAAPNTVHWRVTVDGATFREGATQIGAAGNLHVPYTLNDTHTVEAFSWWAANETSDRNVRAPNSPAIAHELLNCPATPTTPPPAWRAAAPAPVVQPGPQSVVAGTQAAAATRAVAAQRSCAARAAR